MLSTTKKSKNEVKDVEDALASFEKVWQGLRGKEGQESPRKPDGDKRKLSDEDEHLIGEARFKISYLKTRKGKFNLFALLALFPLYLSLNR